jgi:hypothetical protein
MTDALPKGVFSSDQTIFVQDTGIDDHGQSFPRRYGSH